MMDFGRAIALLEDLREDNIPKNLRTRVSHVITILNNGDEPTIKVSKALAELEPACENAQMDSHTRMELFNVVSVLESC
jgi:uncharacterized protein (UPF0147 family)